MPTAQAAIHIVFALPQEGASAAGSADVPALTPNVTLSVNEAVLAPRSEITRTRAALGCACVSVRSGTVRVLGSNAVT